MENDGKFTMWRVNGFGIMQANGRERIYLQTVKSKVSLEHAVHLEEDVLQNEIIKKAGVIYITQYS